MVAISSSRNLIIPGSLTAEHQATSRSPAATSLSGIFHSIMEREIGRQQALYFAAAITAS